MRESFALQKLFFNKRRISDNLKYLKFNEMLTIDVVSFEQPGQGEVGSGWKELNVLHNEFKLRQIHDHQKRTVMEAIGQY